MKHNYPDYPARRQLEAMRAALVAAIQGQDGICVAEAANRVQKPTSVLLVAK